VAPHTDASIITDSIEQPALFEDVFERYYDTIRRYAQRRVGSDVGEELAAQTFLIAFAQRATFDPSYPSARPWLLGIATNLIRHHARSQRVRAALLDRLERPQRVDDVVEVEVADAFVLAPRVLRVLDQMPARDVEAFLLLALAELPYAEIALVLGIPVGTVRSKIHRVRRTLRELFALQEATTGQVNDG
jgi:RNA polymerase sigma factor (sigma-70 family)